MDDRDIQKLRSDIRNIADTEELEGMRADIRRLCIEALKTDGVHHKQWYLEEILRHTGMTRNDVSILRNNEGWEKGIAP